MTTNEVQKIYGNTVSLLDQRKLKAAFGSLQHLIYAGDQVVFAGELDGLHETYRQLLYYFAEGSKDPMQAKIYSGLVVSLYELSDKVLRKILLKDSPQLYYSIKRTATIHNSSITALIDAACSSYYANDLQSAEATIAQLFKTVWTSDKFEEQDFEAIDRQFSTGEKEIEGEGTAILNCQVVSALTLSLINCFDEKKLELLFNAAGCDAEEVKIRAYIGMLLTFYIYRKRIPLYANIQNRLYALSENVEFSKYVDIISGRFILTRDTEKISMQLREEIIPEILKFKDITPEQMEEVNPEWLEEFSSTETGKKLEEFSRLQEEGSDVMHSSFMYLKDFPFFKEVNNWFMPFIPGSISFLATDITGKPLEMFKQTGLICNSDLYSLYFGMKHMGGERKSLVISQMESQLSEVSKQKKAELTTRYDKSEQIAGRYIQDLYRFFKLFSRRGEFFDVFNQRLDFYNIPLLEPYIGTEQLVDFAELYLRKSHYVDAANLFDKIKESNESNGMYYQKTGYCKQMLGDYESALSDYHKAELLDTESKWLMRRMAQCYRALKKPAEAIEYYLCYERLDPDNISNLMSLGSCYIETKNSQEALKYFFKAEYLDEKGQRALRPIAWCSFLLKKYDQARNYYRKIIAHQPDFHDYMNAGHTEWALQNLKNAIELYKKSIETADNDYNKFHGGFVNDIPDLINAGIEEAEIPLVLDKLGYELFP